MKIQVITANNGWFIHQLDTNGSSFNNIKFCYFDGKIPETTFKRDWYKIEPGATHVQKKVPAERLNQRYELKNKNIACDDYPLVLTVEEYEIRVDPEQASYDSAIAALYEHCYEYGEETFVDVEAEFEYLFNYEGDLVEPTFSYEGAPEYNRWLNAWQTNLIKNSDVIHQKIDEIMFPDILLHLCPASLSSKQMYDITRNFIKNNINSEVAEISSDYDFCFKVEKKIKKIKPEIQQYYNLFARTKKERAKLHTQRIDFDKYTVFEMTYSPKNYEKYTAIPAMYADNEVELKEKVDSWLEHVISIINEPLCQCPQCEGRGYLVSDKIIFEEKSCEATI